VGTRKSSYNQEWKDRYLKYEVLLVVQDVNSVRMVLHFEMEEEGQYERKRI
jgi:hypothetical protein